MSVHLSRSVLPTSFEYFYPTNPHRVQQICRRDVSIYFQIALGNNRSTIKLIYCDFDFDYLKDSELSDIFKRYLKTFFSLAINYLTLYCIRDFVTVCYTNLFFLFFFYLKIYYYDYDYYYVTP